MEIKNISIKSEVLPAIFYNEDTKEHIFFNSLIAAFNGWQDKRNDRLKSYVTVIIVKQIMIF